MRKWIQVDIHRIFLFTLLLKGMHAFSELLLGGFLWIASTDSIQRFVSILTKEELTEDPTDKLANLVLNFVGSLESKM